MKAMKRGLTILLGGLIILMIVITLIIIGAALVIAVGHWLGLSIQLWQGGILWTASILSWLTIDITARYITEQRRLSTKKYGDY